MKRVSLGAVGYVSPALESELRSRLAGDGIEVLTAEETAFIDAWKAKHAPRRKYLTDAQLQTARAEYAASKG